MGDKSQLVKAFDLIAFGPFLVWFAWKAEEMPSWSRWAMAGLGVATIAYNWAALSGGSVAPALPGIPPVQSGSSGFTATDSGGGPPPGPEGPTAPGPGGSPIATLPTYTPYQWADGLKGMAEVLIRGRQAA